MPEKEPISKAWLPAYVEDDYAYYTFIGGSAGCLLVPGELSTGRIVRQRIKRWDYEPVNPPYWDCTQLPEVPRGANAEDCERCTDPNPPYPFICPGHPAETRCAGSGCQHERSHELLVALEVDLGLRDDLKSAAVVRTFHLERREDVSGVSGTGRVAEGVIFSDGWAVTHWLGGPPMNEPTTTTWYNKGSQGIEKIHGHDEATILVWHDDRTSSDEAAGPDGSTDPEGPSA